MKSMKGPMKAPKRTYKRRVVAKGTPTAEEPAAVKDTASVITEPYPETTIGEGETAPTSPVSQFFPTPLKQPKALREPRPPLSKSDLVELEGDVHSFNRDAVGDSGSEEGGTFQCMVCKRHKLESHVTTFTVRGKTYCRCKACVNAKANIAKFIQTDEETRNRWEAMGSMPGQKNEFIARCHHAMGVDIKAIFKKSIDHEGSRSVMDEREEGGQLLLSPDVEKLYEGYPQTRREELIALHKANGFAEKSTLTGANKYLSDQVSCSRHAERKVSQHVRQAVEQDGAVKRRPIPGGPRTKRIKDEAAMGASSGSGTKPLPKGVKNKISKLHQRVATLHTLKTAHDKIISKVGDSCIPGGLHNKYKSLQSELDLLGSESDLWLGDGFRVSPLTAKEKVEQLTSILNQADEVYTQVDSLLHVVNDAAKYENAAAKDAASPAANGADASAAKGAEL